MPRTLLLETSSRANAFAVADGNVILAKSEPASPRSTATIGAEVQRLLLQVGIPAKAIEVIGFSAGPGAFTGTRVATAFVKGFAFASGARVVAVPTPEVIIRNLAPVGHGAVVVDARRGSIWVQEFEAGTSGWRATGPGRLEDPARWAGRQDREVLVVGEGVTYHREALATQFVRLTSPEAAKPRVEVVAEIVAAMADNGAFAEPSQVVPTYVRRPEAEEQRMAGS